MKIEAVRAAFPSRKLTNEDIIKYPQNSSKFKRTACKRLEGLHTSLI